MNFEKMDQLIDSLPARGFPGSEVAISHHGKIVYRRAAGFSDANGTKPVSDRDLYWVFSISKITTCVAAMRLVEEERMSMSDPVSKYLPAYANLSVQQPDGSVRPAENQMTVEHLFLMTGGLDYQLKKPAIQEVCKNPSCTTLEIANAIADAPLGFEPGTRYRYSHCHDVLAAVVEVVAGERFADYVQRIILDPLGMKETSYHPNQDMRARLADMYEYEHGLYRSKQVECENHYSFWDGYDSGGAGLCSSVSDQLRLMTVLANNGRTEDGYQLLKPDTIAELQKNRLSDEVKPTFNTSRLYGYGWGYCGRVHANALISGAASSVGEFGWDGAAGAYAMIDPQEQVALYFGTHVKNSHYVYRVIHPALRDLTYEALRDEK